MPVSANTVWEVRPGSGSSTNGGGFVTGASGVDYSQQASAQYALTGVTSAGSGNTVLTASAASNMVGNIAQVISGTNFTTGFFEVTSVVVGVSITFSTNVAAASICSGVGAGGVINIGGALSSLSAGVFTNMAPGHFGYQKATGTDSRGATDSPTIDGTLALPITFIGYNSSRTDLNAATYNTDGSLVTTNYPVISYNQTFRLSGGGADFLSFRNMKVIGTGTGVSSAILTVGIQSVVYQCYVSNPSTNAGAQGLNISTGSIVENCDLLLTGASGGSACLGMGGSGSNRIIRNRFLDSQTSAILITLSGTIVADNVFFAAVVGPAINITSVTTSHLWTIRGNTIQGKTTAIQIAAATFATIGYYGDNHITDNSGTGILSLQDTTSQLAGWFSHNRFRDNGVNVDGWDGWRAGGTVGEVTTDTGGPETDYVDVATDQYTLIPAAPGRAVSIVTNRDIGALQHAGTGTGYPSEDDVRESIVFGGSNEFTGDLVLPAEADVSDAVTYGANGVEFTGTAAIPVADDVLLGVPTGAVNGNVVLPSEDDVRDGVAFGPLAGDTGNVVLPAESDVRNGVDYGSNGTEFEGTLSGGGGGTNFILGG